MTGYVILAMAVSGAFGGLAGTIMLQGDQYVLKDGFTSGYGFDGLVVGLLARGSALGVVLGALFFGFLRSGGINMEMVAQVPSAVVVIIQGVVIIAIAASGILAGREGKAIMTLEQFAVFVGSSLRLATPLLFGATGEIVSEKAGVLNMSIEGMMLTAAFGGALGSLLTGSAAVGLMCGIAMTLPVAFLQAFLSNSLRVNQIVSGIGINILALGATTLGLSRDFRRPFEISLVDGFSTWTPPLLGAIPVIGGPIFDQVWIVLSRDRPDRGCRILHQLHLDRSCGPRLGG